jgi:hypothetical protein
MQFLLAGFITIKVWGPKFREITNLLHAISCKILIANLLLCIPGIHGLYLPASWSGKYTNITCVHVRGSDPGRDVYPEILVLYLNLTVYISQEVGFEQA